MFQQTDRTVTPKMSHAYEMLRDKLGAVDTTFADRDVTADEIRNVLQDFECVLAVHFSHEDEHVLLQSVTTRVPRLRIQARDLCAEYRDMLQKAAEVYRFALTGSASLPWWRELKVRCSDFAQQLARHENDESSLLNEARREGFAKTRA